MPAQWTIKPASWVNDQAQIISIRHPVFVEEQGVPTELEIDGEDDHANHWLAIDSHQKAIGTLRMLPDGHIGRVAVLKTYRQRGIGKALLEAALTFAKEKQFYDIYLNAQVSAIAFYEQLGFKTIGEEFMDAGIPHLKMTLQLAEQRLLGLHSGKFSMASLGNPALNLIKQTTQQLRILSFDLDHATYDKDVFEQALSELARKSRYSDIRLLIANTESIVKRGHRLLKLHRRLPSKIKLKTVSCEPHLIKENWIIADHSGLIVQSIKEPEKLWGDFNNPPVANNHITQFDQLWGRAKDDNNLRQLDL